VSFRFAAAIIAACMVSTSGLADVIPSARAQASNDLQDLFSQACLKNLFHPERVRSWATDHHLTSVQSAEAVAVYAGAGEGGAVWSAPMPSGLFVLALRAQTQACAVFADKADPGAVEAYVGQLMDAQKRTGSAVTVVKEDQTPTPFGRRHAILYMVGGSGSPTMSLFVVITNERPGGPYQATVQVVGKERGTP
jgi:hypothetical protein